MRLLSLLLGCFLLAGCRSADSDASARSEKRRVARAAPVPSGAAASSNSTARVTPIQELIGRVASVNPTLRFVVIDFYPSEVPPLDQRMDVFRQGQKVAEVKITGPARSSNIAADILIGEAQVGDEVRAF